MKRQPDWVDSSIPPWVVRAAVFLETWGFLLLVQTGLAPPLIPTVLTLVALVAVVWLTILLALRVVPFSAWRLLALGAVVAYAFVMGREDYPESPGGCIYWGMNHPAFTAALAATAYLAGRWAYLRRYDDDAAGVSGAAEDDSFDPEGVSAAADVEELLDFEDVDRPEDRVD